jgi:hypothetical protein
MQQAANLAKMRDMQTPLLGGENPDLAGGWQVVVPQCMQQKRGPQAEAAASGLRARHNCSAVVVLPAD